MRILTATDLAGIATHADVKDTHRMICPWCDEDAWAVTDYMQCLNPACKVQVAAPYDVLAKACGSYEQAGFYAAQELGTDIERDTIAQRQLDRRVMDFWINACTTPPTSEVSALLNLYNQKGYGMKYSRFNACVLTRQQMKELMELARDTGAEYPDAWKKNAPGASRVVAVQSQAHTIDRLVVIGRRGKPQEITWHARSAGFCSLIGISPYKPRLLAADIDTAMWLQYELAQNGPEEAVACAFLRPFGDEVCPRWDINANLLLGVTRHCEPQPNPMYYNPDDLIRIQRTVDHFQGLEGKLRGLSIDQVIKGHPRKKSYSWPGLRRVLIDCMIPAGAVQVPTTAVSVFECTGSKKEDAAKLIAHYRKKGRHTLADDVERVSLNKIIAREPKREIRETANEYSVVENGHSDTIANFSLRLNAAVTFPNKESGRFCQGTLRCGTAVTDVLFPQSLLQTGVQNLEETLQRELAVQGQTLKAGKSPTIVRSDIFRRYVIPHLRSQASDAQPIYGVDRLGWSSDRKSFTFPGYRLDKDGWSETSKILCPSVPLLKLYKPVASWSRSSPQIHSVGGHDLIAILLASCVRYFRRSQTKPILVAQSSEALSLLDNILAGLGQHGVYELNQNMREGAKFEGVHGYPFMAAGPRTAGANSHAPYIHLTDTGYVLPEGTSKEQPEDLARAIQCHLAKVVTWCLETGGDQFREVRATEHHRSLIREGAWLLQHVCNQAAWEVSAPTATAFERLLEQIPLEEAGRRMTLVDADYLTIDIMDLECDQDKVLHETKDMGTMAAIKDGQFMASAVKFMPAIANYYGQNPEVAVVDTPT